MQSVKDEHQFVELYILLLALILIISVQHHELLCELCLDSLDIGVFGLSGSTLLLRLLISIVHVNLFIRDSVRFILAAADLLRPLTIQVLLARRFRLCLASLYLTLCGGAAAILGPYLVHLHLPRLFLFLTIDSDKVCELGLLPAFANLNNDPHDDILEAVFAVRLLICDAINLILG